MNPEAPNSEAGEAIAILREQEREATADFVARVRRRIHRRTAASQLATFSWQLPKLVLVEMVGALGHIFSALGGRKEPKP